METIEASYRIVTPMFIGGANQDPSDGIRPPSFKGALRFWWRALNWAKFHQDKNGDETEALKALHQKECRLFGSAAKTVNGEQAGGQGVFSLTIKEFGQKQIISDWPKANTGAGYLAYGILESKGGKRGTPVPHKKGIVEGGGFIARLLFKKNATQEDIESVNNALEVVGLLGGLGSRGSRRGLGSISLLENNKSMSLEDYKNKLNDLFSTQADVSPYTAFSKESFFKFGKENEYARQALDAIGNTYKDFRKEIINQRIKRISFGLPLQGVEVKVRRASPMFIHIQELAGRSFVPVVLYMPSIQFHHEQRYKGVPFDTVEGFVRSKV